MNKTGGGEPKQHFEVVQPADNGEVTKAPVEQQRPAQEAASGKQATPPAVQILPVLPDVPVPKAPTLPGADEDTAKPVASPKTSKLPAADKDLIEKQWVQKAKEIVAETKSDPFKQKNEMSRAKADYIQKRFKKIIKTDNPFDATQAIGSEAAQARRGRPEPGRAGDAVVA